MTDLLGRARPDRPNVVLRRVTRHTWGPDPERVVVVAVLRNGSDMRARVLGAEGGRAVEVESAEVASIPRGRGPLRVQLADGTEWRLVGVGCRCNVPPALKGVNPIDVPAP